MKRPTVVKKDMIPTYEIPSICGSIVGKTPLMKSAIGPLLGIKTDEKDA